MLIEPVQLVLSV